jgi:predicted metalloendopeptidase
LFSVHENYFKWHLFHHYVTDLGSDFLIPYYKFDEAIRGSGEKERYITCVTSITKVVPMSIARLYTDYVLSPGTKERVARVIHEIRLAFEQRLMSNSFLDQVTKERSIWKVGNISEMIAYPSNISNDAYLLDKSKAIINGEGDYFETIKWHNILDIHKNLQKLGKPVDKKEWQLPPTNVNAYYEPKLNEFVFLEGILNAPFIEANWPE